MMIRAQHPYAYRSGEWALVVAEGTYLGRPNYVVKFPDGALDFWLKDDPSAEYEFAEARPQYNPHSGTPAMRRARGF
jgi:hypothetical protein